MARIPKTAILLGAALGLAAAFRRRKPKEEELLLPDVEPPIPEDLPIPEETALGVPVSIELVKSGEYVGEGGTIVWRIFKDQDNLFLYEWEWAQNQGGGRDFSTLEEAEAALLEDMQNEVGQEVAEVPLGAPAEFIKSGKYAGERGTIVWRILRDPTGFFYEWEWSQNSGGGRDFPTLEEAEAALLEDMQNEVGLELDPAEIIRPLIAQSGRPRSGRFYQIRKFDQLVWLVAKVLGVSEDHKYVIPAIRCITFSDWNAGLYGTKWDPDNPLFRKEKAVLKDGQFTVLDKAFFPRHQNALSEMMAGRMPQRTIDNTQEGNPLGVPGANSSGMLWIPVMRLQGDTLLCPEGEWPDGRLQSEPPPEVMAVLT